VLQPSSVNPLKQNKAWNWFLAIIGWLLSPVTWWNDAFVNIPIAYALASVMAWFWAKSFLAAFVIFYWATNVLGSWLLLISGRELIKSRITPKRERLFNILTVVYCIVMSILILKDIVKPIPVPHHEN